MVKRNTQVINKSDLVISNPLPSDSSQRVVQVSTVLEDYSNLFK
jgi:hypothetical protein